MPARQGAVAARVRCLQSRIKYASRAKVMVPTLHDKLIMVPVKVRCFTSVHSIPVQEGRILMAMIHIMSWFKVDSSVRTWLDMTRPQQL